MIELINYKNTISNKNIPIPTKKEYKIQLISKVKSVLKRILWKALQFLRKRESINKETYRFKLGKYPQTIDELIGFENDLMSLINDTKQLKCNNKVIVPADKTHNLYKVEKEDYKKYLRDNTTKTYKMSTNSKVNRVNVDAKKN